MKRILALFSLALLVLVVALTSAFTLTATAEDSNTAENVIYISSSPKKGGKGTSPSDPLYPEQYDDDVLEPTYITRGTETITALSNYKNTALYQAVEKLSETGGTVVIIGNYPLTDANARQTKLKDHPEFHLPMNKKTVTITGELANDTYTTNGKLTLSGKFHTVLNGPTVWENLTIHSDSGRAADRAICCNGYTTVFGEGLKCATPNDLNGDLNPDSVSTLYPSIAGGTINTNFSKDVDVTIKSGTFRKLVGTSWIDGDNVTECNGDVNLKIEGGTIQYVLGNSNNNVNDSIHSGNVDITVTGGKITEWIACTGAGGFNLSTSIVNIKISGGDFGKDTLDRIYNYKVAAGVEFEGRLPGTINIDLSDALNVEDEDLNRIISNLPTDASEDKANVTYPADWVESATMIASPTETFVFSGEELSSTGASVSVKYVNRYTDVQIGGEQTVEYSEDNPLFSAEYDKNADGETTAMYYYGNIPYHTAKVNVIDVPTVEFKGVQIKTGDQNQQMYGWGYYEGDIDPSVTVEKCGIIAIPSDMLATDEPFDHSNTYGMYDAKKERGFIDGEKTMFGALVFGEGVYIRENNYKTDYSLRAYIKIKYEYETGKFAERYIYSNVEKKNFYDVAKKATAKEDVESKETIDYLTENVIGLSDNYSIRTMYNQDASNAARNKVVKYMEDMMNVTWIPQKTFILYNNPRTKYSVGVGSTEMYAIFIAGEEYRGIPYINSTMGQFETFEDMVDRDNNSFWDTIQENIYFDRASIDDLKSFESLILGIAESNEDNVDAIKKAGVANAMKFPGNDCSTSVILAWNTVLNNRPEIQTMTSVNSLLGTQTGIRNGVISVGEFTFGNHYDYNTYNIIDANGQQVMAKAYALLKKGDAVAKYDGEESGSRHVRMVYKDAVPIYNKDGSINLNSSYVMIIDQAAGTDRYIWKNDVSLDDDGRIVVNEPDGSDNKNAGSIQVIRKTFKQLYDEGVLPVTIPELVTGNVDAEFTCASEMNLEEDLPNGVLSGTVKSNRQIISVRAVFSQDGTVVKEFKNNLFNTYWQLHIGEYNLSGLELSGLDLKKGKTYKFDLYACVAGRDGEEVHLVKDYEFTAK